MDEKAGEDEEEILDFIKRQGERGARWTDLTNEFEKVKGWSHGKFVSHWNNIKETHVGKIKDSKTGRDRYVIGEKYEELAEKAMLKSDIMGGRLSSIVIKRSRLEKAAENAETQYVVSRLRGDLDYVGRRVDEEAKKELGKRNPKMSTELSDLMETLGKEVMLEEKDFREQFSRFLERVCVQASFAEEEGAPIFTDEDIFRLFMLVTPKIVSRCTGLERAKPLHLIISFQGQKK
jgi:hypothetical protein